MPERTDQRDAIAAALAAFAARPLADAARGLFAALGYASDRRVPLATPKAFLGQFDAAGRLTDRERETLQRLASLHLLFQFTDAELTSTGDLFDDPAAVQTTQIHSYLFFAAELPDGHYTRTDLSAVARALNKPLPMPALLLLKHGDTVSLAIIHRRLNKRDAERDVLGKATLIKDIRFEEPIRAHLEILNDFALANLGADFGVSNFVALHTAWQRRLGSYALSNDFYREIADWYFWAHHLVDNGTIRLPQHCDTEQEKSLFLIRLLTRVIFCWFLVEKRLIPADLFRDRPLKKLIKDFKGGSPQRGADIPVCDLSSTYYHAVLQNLFFGTLNMPGDLRGFREKKKGGQRYDPNYGITNLWRYETDFLNPADWLKLAESIPFLNGGLFDCLDDKSGKKQDNFILDGFSDNPDLACRLPNDLFFGPERTVDLSKDYGEEDKRTARSKRAKERGLIEILSRYKFTIEENTPLEEEIALDPELLGKVFENLLASYNEDTQTTARKALGAFYTPREIVTYMVDEALKSYLTTQVPKVKGTLDNLFSNAANPKDIKPDLRDALIAAIGRVKILDPACGSGAFPMGALHRLVDLLQKLDPNNELWKRDRLAEAERYCQVLEETGAPKEEIAACHARIEDITKSFDTRFHALDFARKLYLIENGIYGVDIQPVAVQIAKLRFFISLVVDQKVDIKATNLGVRPLPNLETRLVAADTLVPLKMQLKQGDIFDNLSDASRKLEALRNELKRIRHEHFNARDPSRKRHWRDEDQRVRESMRGLLIKTGIPSKMATAMSEWDPYDQNTFATFFDSEWMFGLPVGKFRVQRNAPSTLLGNLALVNDAGGQMEFAESGVQEIESGFDIVIGNPPYIRIQTLKKKDPKLVEFYKDEYESAAKGNYDLYVVFIEAGLRLLKSDGNLAYICPHKFFNAQYGEPVRELIAKGHYLQHVVHFGDQQVFPGATNYVCLLFLTKIGTSTCRYVKATDLGEWLKTFHGTYGNISTDSISGGEWHFSVGNEGRVFADLDKHSIRLRDVTKRIFQGIIPGADKVYALKLIKTNLSLATCWSSELRLEVQIESALLKPLVSGSHVAPYVLTLDGTHVIYPYKQTAGETSLISPEALAKKYPYALAYFEKVRAVLDLRDGGAAAGSEWYRYIRTQNIGLQLLPKIAVPRLVNKLKAAPDFNGEVCLDNVDVGGILVDDASGISNLTLLGLLNSSVLNFYFLKIAAPYRGGYYSANRQFIEPLPIVVPQKCDIHTFDDYVATCQEANRIIANSVSDQSSRDPLMLAYFEQILNGMVYELYFPEEVHAAGLHLFDAVAKAKLPAIETIPEEDRLPRLRTLFETLYDGTHPLRIALDKLQTLDTVRIIEGKAT